MGGYRGAQFASQLFDGQGAESPDLKATPPSQSFLTSSILAQRAEQAAEELREAQQHQRGQGRALIKAFCRARSRRFRASCRVFRRKPSFISRIPGRSLALRSCSRFPRLRHLQEQSTWPAMAAHAPRAAPPYQMLMCRWQNCNQGREEEGQRGSRPCYSHCSHCAASSPSPSSPLCSFPPEPFWPWVG